MTMTMANYYALIPCKMLTSSVQSTESRFKNGCKDGMLMEMKGGIKLVESRFEKVCFHIPSEGVIVSDFAKSLW